MRFTDGIIYLNADDGEITVDRNTGQMRFEGMLGGKKANLEGKCSAAPSHSLNNLAAPSQVTQGCEAAPNVGRHLRSGNCPHAPRPTSPVSPAAKC